jgi:hypothetical protein
MTILSDSVLVESKSARDTQLEQVTHEVAQSVLNKVKTLYFALWQGTGVATTELMAEFYEVDYEVVKKVSQRHRDEFEADGLRTIRGRNLKDVGDKLSLSSKAASLTLWTPRSALRLGMVLRDSPIAKVVRTSLLDIAEAAFGVDPFKAKFNKVNLLSEWLDQHSINPVLVGQWKFNSLKQLCPEDTPILEEARTLIMQSAPQEQQDLTPSELATRLSQPLGRIVKPQEVNQALESLEFQFKLDSPRNPKRWRWELTDKGQEFGKVYLATGEKNRWSGGQIRWSPDVLPLVQPLLEKQSEQA